MADISYCPIELQDNSLNVANHLKVIADHGLGPADPTQSNQVFWKDKAAKWMISEGDARARLCANCEHYLNTSEITQCITDGPALGLKASALPLTPKWADIESRPVAFCTLYKITCSPLRTCDDQEPGGPMDDIKVKAIELANAVQEAGVDVEEIQTSLTKAVNQNVRKAMPYSKSNPPQWASKKSDAVQTVAIQVFNQTLKDTGSEEKARIASLAAMKNAEESFKKKVSKAVEEIIAGKYNLS